MASILQQKIKRANRQWGKAKESVLDVYNQALKDGWTPIEASKICREKLTIFSLRTIRGILPDEAKNKAMKREVEGGGGYKQIAESLPQLTSDTSVTTKQEQQAQQAQPKVMSKREIENKEGISLNDFFKGGEIETKVEIEAEDPLYVYVLKSEYEKLKEGDKYMKSLIEHAPALKEALLRDRARLLKEEKRLKASIAKKKVKKANPNKPYPGSTRPVVCTVCLKDDAMVYYQKQADGREKMYYEHPDEPGNKRCNAGYVTEGLPLPDEHNEAKSKSKSKVKKEINDMVKKALGF